MKQAVIGFLLGWAMVGGAAAQVVLPGGAKSPVTRPIGGGVNGGVNGGASISGGTPAPAKQRYTTHIVLSESRVWQNLDGRTLEGKLLAFEDVVTEVVAGAGEPPAPVPPANPTVVRNGKVRLLVGKKPFELPLTNLVKADQEFIESIRAALAKKAVVKP